MQWIDYKYCVCDAGNVCFLHQARLQRGNIKLKQGKLDDAKIDFEYIVSFFYMFSIILTPGRSV